MQISSITFFTSRETGLKQAAVARVIDGDTIVLSDGTEVRLLGINTPEKGESGYKEAAAAITKLLLKKNIFLKTKGEDGYGRTLAIIYDKDNQDINSKMIAMGRAHVMIVEPKNLSPQTIKHYLNLQEIAKRKKIGIWDPKLTQRFQGALHITSFHANGKGDDEKDPTVEYMRIANISDKVLNLSNYKIQNLETKEVFKLPPIELPPGWTVVIHSGKGKNQTDPSTGALIIYLQTEKQIWDDSGAMVIILDSKGNTIDCKRSRKKFHPEIYKEWSFLSPALT